MSIYSSPPPLRAFRDDKATLLVCWWCTIFAAVIILFRVCGRYIRTEKLFKEDRIAFLCIIPLLARMALVHVVLLYGTNNTTTAGLSDLEIHKRSIGSRLVLVSRIFYAVTLWMLKLTICEFFKRLTWTIWTTSHERMLQIIKWFLLATFIAVVIADLAECQPFDHYWQVIPDPGGKCRQGYAQLITMGSANVLSDLLLVVFPIPIIIRSRMGLKRKIQLVLLFALSLLPAGTTLYRIPMIIDRSGSQQYRSLLASVEILFATAVANALVLGSFVRDRGVKKQRWKFGSASDSVERTNSRRGTITRAWGSDEDLVRDIGLGIDPELRGSIPTAPRPAPMAIAGNFPVKAQVLMGTSWNFPGERSDTSDEIDFMKIPAESHSPGYVSSINTPRKVSFFDVGGLLDEDQPRRLSSRTETDGESSNFSPLHSTYSNSVTNEGLTPLPPPRRGSVAFLQDVGGLLAPRRDRRDSAWGIELHTIHQERSPQLTPVPSDGLGRHQANHSLQDVGGLLK